MKMGLDFLATVVESKRVRLEKAKSYVSFYNLRASAYERRTSAAGHTLSKTLNDEGLINIIAEIKKASPSKGNLGLKATVD